MRKRIAVFCGLAALVVGVGVAAAASFHAVKSGKFDPAHTNLVSGTWENAAGCPNDSRYQPYGGSLTTYTDPACATADNRGDRDNKGLVLIKTGPSDNFAAAGATLKDAPSSVSELGYDLRKAGGDPSDTRGSHCGAGAPRFDIVDTSGNVYFVGCTSPPPTVTGSSTAWMRLRWSQAYTSGGVLVALSSIDVKSISIVFDEGTDAGPDYFGIAVLDNIDVNGKMIGRP